VNSDYRGVSPLAGAEKYRRYNTIVLRVLLAATVVGSFRRLFLRIGAARIWKSSWSVQSLRELAADPRRAFFLAPGVFDGMAVKVARVPASNPIVSLAMYGP